MSITRSAKKMQVKKSLLKFYSLLLLFTSLEMKCEGLKPGGIFTQSGLMDSCELGDPKGRLMMITQDSQSILLRKRDQVSSREYSNGPPTQP